MIGVGMVVALLVDAILVRLLLVPATLRLLGRHNWWAPGPLSRLYGRYGCARTTRWSRRPRRSTTWPVDGAEPAATRRAHAGRQYRERRNLVRSS
jgi:RND superfamily putative drug exporter